MEVLKKLGLELKGNILNVIKPCFINGIYNDPETEDVFIPISCLKSGYIIKVNTNNYLICLVKEKLYIYKVPTENLSDISDCEFESIKNNPYDIVFL